MSRKNYNELMKLKTFEERFRYLQLHGAVARETFGFERYLNQRFYRSKEWRRFRRDIIARDEGCDLGIEDRPIGTKVYIHHMNPITNEDLIDGNLDKIMNPDEVICVSHQTHEAIHYGDETNITPSDLTERQPNDTVPWR